MKHPEQALAPSAAPTELIWQLPQRALACGLRPLLMGIVNVTPDSFSDGGRFTDVQAAVDHALRLEDEGADILDVGAESTRPGAAPVPLTEECRRLLPVIERLLPRVSVPVSIDTYKAAVAQPALDLGATIVNDISGLQFDPEMPSVVAQTGAGVVCMHIRGTPQTMQDDPQYDNVSRDISQFFRDRLAVLQSHGVAPEQVVFDPGVGFGKTAEHNLEILSSVAAFRQLGRPVLIGHSRKGFLKRILGRPIDERLFGTLGVSIALASQGADILRVHDVRETRDALRAWRVVTSWKYAPTSIPMDAT